MVASAAKNSVRRPRLMIPAAASEASSSRPSPLAMPPLAYVSRVMKKMSRMTCTVSCRSKSGAVR